MHQEPLWLTQAVFRELTEGITSVFDFPLCLEQALQPPHTLCSLCLSSVLHNRLSTGPSPEVLEPIRILWSPVKAFKPNKRLAWVSACDSVLCAVTL